MKSFQPVVNFIASYAASGTLVFKVLSRTEDNVYYKTCLNVINGRTSCNCMAGQNGKKCWHLKEAAKEAAAQGVIINI